jgi:hypothetical protein
MKNWFIVSVESRKGGVGKTTAALNLARIFNQRHYAVLFLDVDITGTNAADAIDSPFWKSTTHTVRHADSDNHLPANLLALFQTKFMSGQGAPKFSAVVEDSKHALTIDSNLINVLGSQIYNFENSKSERQDRIICKPSILFDELHAFWFIEFLQGTCVAFTEAIRATDNDRMVAIIIDNSPGYVGIAPAVQEWLTDLGPNRGKFLTVASMDKQDLVSCGRSVHGLHSLILRKWEASRKFAKACISKDKSEPLNLNQEEQGFFLRLAESSNLDSLLNENNEKDYGFSGSDLSYYRDENISLPSPAHYQGFLINRVPRLVKSGAYQYDKNGVYTLLEQSRSNVMHDLIGDERGDYSQWMVSYDEYIEYQFIQSMISRRSSRHFRGRHNAEEMIERMIKRRPVPSDEPIQELLHPSREWTRPAIGRLQQYIRGVNDIVLNVIHLLDQQGFAHITKLIQNEWLPNYAIQDFRYAIRDFIMDTRFPHFESVPWDDETDSINPEVMELMERLPHIFKRSISEAPISHKLADQFIPSLAAVIGLTLSGSRWHSPFIEEFGELFAAIAAVEASRWERREEKTKSDVSLQKFLANESLTKKEAQKLFMEIPIHPRWIEENLVPRLYRTCASAQARLLDMRQDTEFLLQLIYRLVREEIQDAPVLPYIKDVAENVIIKKAISHETGQRQIAKGFSSAQYMKEFSTVLERILTRWEEKACSSTT